MIWPLIFLVALASPSAPADARARKKKSAQATAAAEPKTAFDILGWVQAAYHHKSLRARFSQTYIDAVTGARPTESGVLEAAGDGRVRFVYAAPHAKTFVFDGNDAFFYEPEAAQVTVIDHFAEAPVAQTMSFLWGNGPITTAFASALCTDEEATEAGRGHCIMLTPKKPMAGVQKVILRVEQGTFEVQQTDVVDALGNRTRYRLEGRERGVALAHSIFHFIVPGGVSVLHTRP